MRRSGVRFPKAAPVVTRSNVYLASLAKARVVRIGELVDEDEDGVVALP